MLKLRVCTLLTARRWEDECQAKAVSQKWQAKPAKQAGGEKG